MAKYTKEEKEIIEGVKEYLKNMRTLKNERLSLQLEYEAIPTPQSPNISDEIHSVSSRTKDQRLNSYIVKRDMLLKRIELFDEVIDEFTLKLYLLKAGQRNIINAYINSHGYNEMIQLLDEQYCISESTYSRNINDICLKISRYIDYDSLITIHDLNNEYLKCVSKMTVD